MGFFNSYTKPGKGISKEDVQKSGIPLYFDIFFRRFWKFISLNLLYMLASIPAIVISFVMANYFIGLIITVMQLHENEAVLNLMPFISIPFAMLLFQITGSGPATVSHNYTLRKYVKDTHVWLWTDFVGCFKRNFLQGLAVYIINVLVVFLLFFGFLFYRFMMPGKIQQVLSIFIMVTAVIFFIMQKYTYMLVSGFELKTIHIFKNAFILTMAGLVWNLFSAVVVGAMTWGICCLYVKIPAVAIFVIFGIYFSIITFTQLFITNNTVKKYLEEPALQNTTETEE